MMASADSFCAFDGLAASKDNLRVQCQTGTLVSEIVAVIHPFLIAAPPLEILAEAFLPSALDPEILGNSNMVNGGRAIPERDRRQKSAPDARSRFGFDTTQGPVAASRLPAARQLKNSRPALR
jgi:hypothetical protein